MSWKEEGETVSKTLGQFIVERRTELGMTGEELAWMSGLSRAYISHIENNKRLPSRESSRRSLERALGLEPGELFNYFPSLRGVLTELVEKVQGYMADGDYTPADIMEVIDRAKTVLAKSWADSMDSMKGELYARRD